MKINEEVSNNINLLRFPLIAGVVFIHMGANYENAIMHSHAISASIYQFIIFLFSNVVFSSVVPVFFVISGYLYFATYKPSFDCYYSKLKSRFITLFVPYMFWNVSYLIFKLIVQSTPFLAEHIGGGSERVINFTLFQYIDSLFAITGFPISYQFWFIRDLILLIIVSPLIWIAIDKLSWLVIIVLLVTWFLGIERVMNVHVQSWLFFCFGCLVAKSNFQLILSKTRIISIVLLYSVFAILLTAEYTYHYELMDKKIVVIMGVPTIWYASYLLLGNRKIVKVLSYVSPYAFFIYAAHEPILGILVKMIMRLEFDDNYSRDFLLYFACPVIVILFLWAFSSILNKTLPRLYSFATGGRI